MNYRITEQIFYKYLKCPSWVAREALHGDDLREPLLAKLQDEGLLREKELELLGKRAFVEVEAEDLDEAAAETLELMKKGTETIYKGVLIDGNWVGRPDILEKVEGKSKLGNWYYVACDIKRSHHLKDEYQFQGVFYAEILKRLQGVTPVQGYVMHADGTVENYLIEDFYTQFRLTMDSIERILEGSEEPHFLTAGCKQTPYFSECHETAQKCDDLSRLNRLWRSEADLLNKSGIMTVTDLANATVDQLKKIHGLSMDRLYVLQQQSIALTDNRIIRLGEPDLPEENDVALVIDIESDPLRSLDYLFGVLVVDGEEQTYHSFLAKAPADEKANWKEFVSFLDQYAGANIYHYGWFETDVFRNLTEKYGAPENVKTMFEEQTIDLLGRLREKIIFPISFYSLKDIAKFLGFKWRSQDASGVDSILWYEDWLTTGNEKVLQEIVDYNEDDVRATWFVRNWAVTGK